MQTLSRGTGMLSELSSSTETNWAAEFAQCASTYGTPYNQHYGTRSSSACDSKVGQNPLLRGKLIPVTHCDSNLLQVGAGGSIWPAET